MRPQSFSKEAPWDLTQFSQLSSAARLNFPESHWQSEISSLSKVILVWGKARSPSTPNLGCRGWVTWVIWCFMKNLCTRRDPWAGTSPWWSCQSPVARSCGLLNHPNSFRRGMFKINSKFDADLLLYLLCHFECNGHTIHMLTQCHPSSPLTSTVKSSLFTHAHSSPLCLAARLHWCGANHSHYINNGWNFFWTYLVCTHIYMCVCKWYLAHNKHSLNTRHDCVFGFSLGLSFHSPLHCYFPPLVLPFL